MGLFRKKTNTRKNAMELLAKKQDLHEKDVVENLL